MQIPHLIRSINLNVFHEMDSAKLSDPLVLFINGPGEGDFISRCDDRSTSWANWHGFLVLVVAGGGLVSLGAGKRVGGVLWIRRG